MQPITELCGCVRLQAAGFTVVAEKLNFFRYLSHFRSVHRGAYFMQIRTTAVRKLLPESFGFMCPVHTPDGSPCGLLNHLTHRANIVAYAPAAGTHARIVQMLAAAGMAAATAGAAPPAVPEQVAVLLDGRVAGFVPQARAPALVARLRNAKMAAGRREGRAAAPALPEHAEIAYLPYERGGPFPAIVIQVDSARLARHVRHLASGQLEYVGTLEQSTLNIRCACCRVCLLRTRQHTALTACSCELWVLSVGVGG